MNYYTIVKTSLYNPTIHLEVSVYHTVWNDVSVSDVCMITA